MPNRIGIVATLATGAIVSGAYLAEHGADGWRGAVAFLVIAAAGAAAAFGPD